MIPAIDLRGGRCVRLAQGDYSRETVYDEAPERRAAEFASAGAPRIHVVDLDGAREGSPANAGALRAILEAAGAVPVQAGGGVRGPERIDELVAWGVDRVVVGTLALENPELVREAAGRHPGRLVLGLDANDGRVAVRGWRETSARRVEEVLDEFAGVPLAAVLHTDIARDGMLCGPNLEATVALARRSAFPVLASGGVAGVADLERLARSGVVGGAIVGRALYEGAFELGEAIRAVARC